MDCNQDLTKGEIMRDLILLSTLLASMASHADMRTQRSQNQRFENVGDGVFVDMNSIRRNGGLMRALVVIDGGTLYVNVDCKNMMYSDLYGWVEPETGYGEWRMMERICRRR